MSVILPALSLGTMGYFEMIMESLPVLLHGSTTHSSGVLLSGRLKFNVDALWGEATLTTLKMVLQMKIELNIRAFRACSECVSCFKRMELSLKAKFLWAKVTKTNLRGLAC